jgi:hypothetical protein
MAGLVRSCLGWGVDEMPYLTSGRQQIPDQCCFANEKSRKSSAGKYQEYIARVSKRSLKVGGVR